MYKVEKVRQLNAAGFNFFAGHREESAGGAAWTMQCLYCGERLKSGNKKRRLKKRLSAFGK